MITYIPKIIYSSPTELPPVEKLLFYYIIHSSFINESSVEFEIDKTQMTSIIANSKLELLDSKAQINSSINNLSKIKMSLVDNGFHIKLSPIESIYSNSFSNTLYISLNPIIVDYLDQINYANFVSFNILTNSVITNKDF